MVNLAKAVHQTRNYAAYFHSHLDDEGLHHWLISEKIVSKDKLFLYSKKLTQTQLGKINKRKIISQNKIKKAERIAHFLSYFPTISLVAVTGSLAVANASEDDDLDFFIVTHAATLWLTRLIVIPLIGIFFKRRLPKYQIPNIKSQIADSVCLNLWLDESALAVPENRRSLYTAHEVLQAKPLFDRGGTYAKFILANSWASKYLANAYKIASAGMMQNHAQIPWQRPGMRAWLLRIPNWIAFKLQYSYMKSKITHETISLHAAYFHPNDYASRGIIGV